MEEKEEEEEVMVVEEETKAEEERCGSVEERWDLSGERKLPLSLTNLKAIDLKTLSDEEWKVYI
jgi:hypothetical protein